jgi:probable HAF family extracellular repeat protein
LFITRNEMEASMQIRRGTAGPVIAALALIGAGSTLGCREDTLTQPENTSSYYVASNATVFPESVSTTGIPYIRVRIPGEVTRAGSLLDMNEAGLAVGSRIRAAGQPLWAVVVNVRTGDTNSIGSSFSGPNQAKAINARGEIVGGEPLLGSSQEATAFHWRDGVLTVLGSGSATDINATGVVVGYSWDGVETYPWIWHGSEIERLGTASGRAYAINNHGDIVGTAPEPGIARWRPVLWRAGAVTVLNPTGGEANDINETGQIVGQAFNPTVSHREAFLWQNGVVSWLGTLPEGGVSAATAINDRGEIVGVDTLPEAIHAVLWRGGRIIDLGLSGRTVPFENISEAFGITNSGQVIGRVGQGGNRNGVIWTPPQGN